MPQTSNNILQKKKVGCIRIDGGTSSTSRQALVADFQEKDSIKAAVVGYFSAWLVLCFVLVFFFTLLC